MPIAKPTRVAALAALLCCCALPAAAGAETRSAAESPAACANVAYGRAPAAAPRPDVPPNPNGPTLVAAGVFVTQLREIDAVRDDFRFRGYVRAVWCDPRLAGDGERIYVGAEAEREIERVWTPWGFPVNRAGGFEVAERVLKVHADGTVESDLNFSAQLTADYDLRRFPFDRQLLELQIESFRWHRDELVWVSDDAAIGFEDGFSIPEWRIRSVGSRVEEVTALRSTTPISRFVLEIAVDRESGFYLWKVMLPIFIIVGLSWSIFWMPDEPLAGRTRLAATGVLTIVAYQFVIAKDLPRIAYLTLLDQVMLLSFGLLSVTVIQSMLVARYQASNPPRAMRIDKASRLAFPAAYATLLGLLLGWAG